MENRSFRDKFIYQATPIVTCAVLLAAFMILSYLFIEYLINPYSDEKIVYTLQAQDVLAGFLLYFLTAIDYALVIGRMQINNSGLKARFVMNFFTCVGCFMGVTFILFLWGFAKEIPWLIIPILVFAGSVMIKLAHEGTEYFESSKQIPGLIRVGTMKLLDGLYYPARIFTYWMPALNKPRVGKMSYMELAKWSFFLPFIIGTDDLVGYMGAMTIYNVFGLLFGIYLADILIDILVFLSPALTKKIVENAVFSLFGAYAFLFLAYKSFTESYHLLHAHYHVGTVEVLLLVLALIGLVFIADTVAARFKKEPL